MDGTCARCIDGGLECEDSGILRLALAFCALLFPYGEDGWSVKQVTPKRQGRHRASGTAIGSSTMSDSNSGVTCEYLVDMFTSCSTTNRSTTTRSSSRSPFRAAPIRSSPLELLAHPTFLTNSLVKYV